MNHFIFFEIYIINITISCSFIQSSFNEDANKEFIELLKCNILGSSPPNEPRISIFSRANIQNLENMIPGNCWNHQKKYFRLFFWS